MEAPKAEFDQDMTPSYSRTKSNLISTYPLLSTSMPKMLTALISLCPAPKGKRVNFNELQS
jgi:hypothetical protein